MRKLTVLAVMIFGFVSAAAAAPKIDISAGYNYARMISAGSFNSDFFKQDSFNGYGMAADLYISPEISLGIEAANLAGFSDKINGTEYWTYENSTEMKITELGLRAKYNYSLTEKISLYGLLGAGKYRYTHWNYDDHNAIGFNIGAGAKMMITDSTFMGLDLRYHFLPEWIGGESSSSYQYKYIKSGAGLFVPTFFMGYSF